ncbi:MAG: hypothetical protein KGM44_09200, partial [bacterium]|nr:hypothetical protein [bacterium]
MNLFEQFWTFMQQGGFDMWILLLLSIVTVAIVIERYVFFARQHGDPTALLKQIGQRIAANDINGAIEVCRKAKGMLPRVLEFGLYRGDKSRADIT